MTEQPDERVVVLSTAPDDVVATDLAALLVGERLAACGNVVPGVRSVYRWQGEIQQDGEVMLVAKTVSARLPELIATLREAHPYDCPEIIALPVQGGLPDYLDWVGRSTAPETGDREPAPDSSTAE